MRIGTRVLGFWWGVVPLLMAGGLHAQSADVGTRAYEAYARGQRLFQSQDYAAAQLAFEAAYDAVPNPVVLLSIAEAQQQRSMWTEAIATLERYLIERPEAPDRGRVQQEIAALRGAHAPVIADIEPKRPPPRIEEAAPSPFTLVHDNRMSGTYELVKAVYSLDATAIAMRADGRTGVAPGERRVVHRGQLKPGTHTLKVAIEYRGRSRGLFAYLNRYSFKVHAERTFRVPSGTVVRMTVVGYERGGPTTRIQDRPAIRFEGRADPPPVTAR